MRVLVTGSRAWRDGALIRKELGDRLTAAQAAGDNQFVVVHGACKSGADAYADAWARWHLKNPVPGITVDVERHHAKWERPCTDQCQPHHRRHDARGWDLCPAAGYYRNEDMVLLGANECLAFIADESKGSTHCAGVAADHHIPVTYFRVGVGADTLF